MIRVRGMTFADLSLGLRLRQQAGWNQTAADWARFLSLQPDGCFVAEWDGIPAGTVTTCVFGPVAWVGMMLVEASRRGHGIGRALMTKALAFLDDRGVRSVRLDATPQGEPLYRSLGFVPQFRLGRWEGELRGGEGVSGVEVGRVQDWDSILRLDREATGTDRRKLLLELFHEYPRELRVVRSGGAVAGYLTARRGLRALYVGPCLATAEAGPLLLADAWQRHAGQEVILDIPANHAAATWVRQHGLREQRPLLRMCRGDLVVERLPQLWASSGPEKG